MKFFYLIASLFLWTISNAQSKKDSIYYAKLSEAGVKMIPVYNGKYKVFTQKIGNGNIKLLLLHGGPCNSHEYFEIFPEYLIKQGITIYYYEQLGSYYSDQPDDSTIWNVKRFVEEVEEVRKGLNIDSFYLLGHSWGGMLAELYAQKYQKHLKGLVLSNVPSYSRHDLVEMNEYNKFVDSLNYILISKFKSSNILGDHSGGEIDSVKRGLRLSDTIVSNIISKELAIINDSMERMIYYHKGGALPDAYQRDTYHINRSEAANRFTYKIWVPDYKKAIQDITVPTLLIGGKYDYVMPSGYYKIKNSMNKAKCRIYICPNSAHFSMWDDSENYFRELTRFIKEVDKGMFDPNK